MLIEGGAAAISMRRGAMALAYDGAPVGDAWRAKYVRFLTFDMMPVILILFAD